ncbi:hypothetical protein [Atopomonas sediminilitoris]|uniref:hypothetical protein n=1 Tax=Atopomonas sediminilitoris TaxID=2919919 RepID=UPI001F4E673D|nr:hypothetical protein [Atopomonas sediminilitoris]MCJ8168625.1 hypothetical protein [Atopomonas sediminilitoris]
MQKYLNNWQSVLTAGISAADVSVPINSADAAKLSLSGADYYVATLEQGGTLEVVKITAVSGATLTIERGQEGTTVSAWATGAALEMRLTAAALSRHEQASSTDWGQIGGMLSNQADLQSALAARQPTESGKGLSSNDYTDSEKNKLASVATGATANADTDSLNEGASNLYHTAARVRDTVLAGLSTATNAAITAADSVLTALGKLQAQIAGKEATLTAGANIIIDRSNPNAPVISAAASGGGGSGEGITKANFLQKFFAHEIAVTPEDVNRFKDVGIAVSQASFGNYTPARTCSTGYSDGGSVVSYSAATATAYGFIPGANAASFAAVAGGSILEGSYAAENDFIKFALSNVAQVEYEYIIKCNASPDTSNPYYVAMGGGLTASKTIKPGDNGGGFAVTLADNENAGQFRFVYRSEAGVPTYVDLTGGITANQKKKIRISLTRAGTSGPWTANIYIDDILMTTVVDLGFIYSATYIAPGARFFRTAANSNTVVFYIKSARAAVLLK